jgi:hypothetical protein
MPAQPAGPQPGRPQPPHSPALGPEPLGPEPLGPHPLGPDLLEPLTCATGALNSFASRGLPQSAQAGDSPARTRCSCNWPQASQRYSYNGIRRVLSTRLAPPPCRAVGVIRGFSRPSAYYSGDGQAAAIGLLSRRRQAPP